MEEDASAPVGAGSGAGDAVDEDAVALFGVV